MKRYQVIKAIIALLLCVATIYIYYPGSYNGDTWGQYLHQSRNWVDDWWGPGLSYLWKLLIYLTGSFKSLYYLQMIAYWVLLTLLVWHCRLRSAQFWMVMGLGVFFSFIPQYLMRDTLMALAWGFAFLLMLRLNTTSKLAAKICLIVLIVALTMYGLLLRSNAVVAVVPFIMGLFVAIRNRISVPRLVIYSLGLGVLIIFATSRILYDGFDAQRQYPDYKLKLLDIAGITKLSGQNYFPVCLTSDTLFDSAYVINNHTPATFDEVYWHDKTVPPPNAELNTCVGESWEKAVSDHPLLYLENRGVGFLYYLRIKKRFTNEEYWNATIEIEPNNPFGLTLHPRPVRDMFQAVYEGLGRVYFFDPWLWLAANIVLFLFTLRLYRKNSESYLKILLCVQLSAIIYMLSQLPVYQYDRYFRYNYWNVMIVILTVGAIRRKKN